MNKIDAPFYKKIGSIPPMRIKVIQLLTRCIPFITICSSAPLTLKTDLRAIGCPCNTVTWSVYINCPTGIVSVCIIMSSTMAFLA